MIKYSQLESYTQYLENHYPATEKIISKLFEVNNLPIKIVGPYLDEVCNKLCSLYPDTSFWYSISPLSFYDERFKSDQPGTFYVRILVFGDGARDFPEDFGISSLDPFKDLYFA
jgi:hypothetical protein